MYNKQLERKKNPCDCIITIIYVLKIIMSIQTWIKINGIKTDNIPLVFRFLPYKMTNLWIEVKKKLCSIHEHLKKQVVHCIPTIAMIETFMWINKFIMTEICLASDHTSEIPFFQTLWQMALSQYLLHNEITCAWDDLNVSMECLRSFPQWLVLLYRQSHSHDRWCNSMYNSKTWP